LAVRHDSDAIVYRVQLGFLALASRTGIGWIFADGKSHALRAFAPLKVVRPLFVAFLLAIDED
jgi:hypothetical protein